DKGEGGEVHLKADVNLKPTRFSVEIDIQKPLELAPYLPAQVRKLAGTKLQGTLLASGNWEKQELDKLDLHLGRAHVTGLAYREDRVEVNAKTGARTKVQKIY